MKRLKSKTLKLAAWGFCVVLLSFAVGAQSRDQNFPTPVTTNEISGSIKARDVGDSRLTSYFYIFDGGQGDIFINVVTKNFTGDIDVFTQEALRPLTKMVIYSDAAVDETGRLIYLRKPERLILRIEGRTPNDDPAPFRIKFAGSFIAIRAQKGAEAPSIDRAPDSDESRTRVNSVGTIIEVRPKPLPPVKSKEAKIESSSADAVKEKKTVVVIEDKLAKKPTESPSKTVTTKPVKPAGASRTANPPTKPPVAREEKKPDPLASIRLVIQLKDGNVIQRPMSEVVKFSVDKGVLVVIAKNGKIVRYSIHDVAKVTIE